MERRRPTSRPHLWLVAALSAVIGTHMLSPTDASAQPAHVEVGAMAGLGVQRGAGQGISVTERAPLFLELSYREWNPELPDLVLGGALRAEVEGAGAIGGLPRVELRKTFGMLEFRPGAAFVFFIAPKTLLGPEVSLTAHLALPRQLQFFAMLSITAYLKGSDLPKDTALIAAQGGVGVALPF